MRDIDIAIDRQVGRRPRHARLRPRLQAGPAADLYRVNTTTGERTLMFKGSLTGATVLGISPNGKQFLYWKDNKIQAYDLDAATSRTLGGTAAVSFVGHGIRPPRPEAVVRRRRIHEGRQGRHRAASLRPVGRAARRIRRAQSDERLRRQERSPLPRRPRRLRWIRWRTTGLAARRPSGRFVDLSKPVTLSAYGEYTKKAGFFELANGQLRELVYEDAAFSTPVRAAKAETYLFTRQTFVEFPDLRVSGPDFKDREEDHATRTRSRPSTSGAAASCSTTRTRTACACRAFSRFRTTTSRARSGR